MILSTRPYTSSKDLRRSVGRMLKACEAGDSVFVPGGALSGALWNELCRRRTRGQLDTGDRVGAWRIVDTLGHGGMATVYLAERADGQFEQRVALKLVRNVSGETVLRFQQERQILASLNHPGIARLYDGGVTGDGTPWLAMELIEGEPIDWRSRKRICGQPSGSTARGVPTRRAIC